MPAASRATDRLSRKSGVGSFRTCVLPWDARRTAEDDRNPIEHPEGGARITYLWINPEWNSETTSGRGRGFESCYRRVGRASRPAPVTGLSAAPKDRAFQEVAVTTGVPSVMLAPKVGLPSR
jgi:hypothetical protein